ncbi:hypothetical protein DL95DRAFT_472192 [Leptodontidium sp. 2 PMI_412]|nr:hypothetical protein DL95DRAFT_472192 [Leptodontidium sp. 2 PMI_412]
MSPEISVIFVLGLKIPTLTGPPRAGKSTLSSLLTGNFPAQHVSVGNLLRRIKKV